MSPSTSPRRSPSSPYARFGVSPTTYTPPSSSMAPETPRGSFVRFPENGSPVTGESRTPSRGEDTSFKNFELHAEQCPSCHNCYERYMYGHHLCHQGSTFAHDILLWVYPEDDHVYVRHSFIPTRVELDNHRHRQVKQLMKLYERHGTAALEPTGRRSSQPSRPDSGIYMGTAPAMPEYPIYNPPPQPAYYPVYGSYVGSPYAQPPVPPAAPTPPVPAMPGYYPAMPVYAPVPVHDYTYERRRSSRSDSPSRERSESVRATVGPRHVDISVPRRRRSGRR